MSHCPTCSHQINPSANFCNHCGSDLRATAKVCPSCTHKNTAVTIFCHKCSYQFGTDKYQLSAYKPQFNFHLNEPKLIPEEVKAHFFKFLRERIFEEQDGKKYSDYTGRFYDSRFREIYEIRARQITSEILKLYNKHGDASLPQIDMICYKSFDGLADFFLIQYCPDLNQNWLPAEILKYEKHPSDKPVTWDMVRDFLDFSKEREVFYFDFIGMPEKLLQNAVSSFICAEKGEKLYFICDLSLNGSCKEGVAVTNKGIYWRLPFGKPKAFAFEMLYEVRKEKNWLVINENHLMVNPGFDLKLLKLLKRVMPEREILKKSSRVHLVV
jgi:hypothetical protein